MLRFTTAYEKSTPNICFGLGLFLITCSENKTTSEQLPPNIILLMGDDHGWEETAYNGHPFLQTPVLNEMAAGGLRLDRFYSAAPSCSPTRGSVITGRHPNRYGTFAPGWSIRPSEISVAQLLQQSGYTTGHFGKWHLGPVKSVSPTNPGAMGFQTWLSHDNFFEMDPVFSRDGGPPEQFKGESSEIIIDETIRFIEKSKAQAQPFFAVVWFGSPHEPYSAVEEDLALYRNLPDSLENHMVRLTSMETGEQVERPLRSVLQERFAEITAMDRAIGKLRDYLELDGIRNNTLVWYCGDNGVPASGIYNKLFRGRKGTVYEEGIRVPGIIEWPDGIAQARASEVNTVTSDILPTLIDLAGQKPPNRPLDGISLVPLLEGNMDRREAPIFFWKYDIGHELAYQSDPLLDPELQVGTTPLVKKMGGLYTRNFRNFKHQEINDEDFNGPRVVLDNEYKLVIDGDPGTPSKELFNVKNDPQETNNLIESTPEIASVLEDKMLEWQQSVLLSLTGHDYQ